MQQKQIKKVHSIKKTWIKLISSELTIDNRCTYVKWNGKKIKIIDKYNKQTRTFKKCQSKYKTNTQKYPQKWNETTNGLWAKESYSKQMPNARAMPIICYV